MTFANTCEACGREAVRPRRRTCSDTCEEALVDLFTLRRSAVLSPCTTYRFTLTRKWDNRPPLLVIMFNPSTADSDVDDPTITLLCQIASNNGYGGIVVVNLCPLRSSDPELAFEMLDRAKVDGDVVLRRTMWKNLEVISDALSTAGAVLVAWGAMGYRAGDWLALVQDALRCQRAAPMFHLGLCANGHPKHPMARGIHKVSPNAQLLPWRL